MIIAFICSFLIIDEYIQMNPLFKFSEIKLKIKNVKTFTILSQGFFLTYKPCEIYINGEYSFISNEFTYNYTSNFLVKINWNVTINSTENMFNFC